MQFISTGFEGAGDAWRLSGELTLNGRTRPVTLDVEFHGLQEFHATNRNHAGFSATGAIRRSEFGMTPLGADKLALGDVVQIELDLESVEPHEAA